MGVGVGGGDDRRSRHARTGGLHRAGAACLGGRVHLREEATRAPATHIDASRGDVTAAHGGVTMASTKAMSALVERLPIGQSGQRRPVEKLRCRLFQPVTHAWRPQQEARSRAARG